MWQSPLDGHAID